jgi:hypothetical protein
MIVTARPFRPEGPSGAPESRLTSCETLLRNQFLYYSRRDDRAASAHEPSRGAGRQCTITDDELVATNTLIGPVRCVTGLQISG